MDHPMGSCMNDAFEPSMDDASGSSVVEAMKGGYGAVRRRHHGFVHKR